MKVEHTPDGRRLVHFRTLPWWLASVEAGRKTAEVRVLNTLEMAELFGQDVLAKEPALGELPPPDGLVLVSTNDKTHVVQRRVTYAAAVGELVGSWLVLFCMEPESFGVALEGTAEAPAAFVDSNLRDEDGRPFYYRLGVGPIVPGVIEELR